MRHYESTEAATARAEFEKLHEAFVEGKSTPRELATARRRWHKLRDRDREIEAAVRAVITPVTVLVWLNADDKVEGVTTPDANAPSEDATQWHEWDVLAAG